MEELKEEKPGTELLSRWGNPQSIVAAEVFHNRVREGVGVEPQR